MIHEETAFVRNSPVPTSAKKGKGKSEEKHTNALWDSKATTAFNSNLLQDVSLYWLLSTHSQQLLVSALPCSPALTSKDAWSAPGLPAATHFPLPKKELSWFQGHNMQSHTGPSPFHCHCTDILSADPNKMCPGQARQDESQQICRFWALESSGRMKLANDPGMSNQCCHIFTFTKKTLHKTSTYIILCRFLKLSIFQSPVPAANIFLCRNWFSQKRTFQNSGCLRDGTAQSLAYTTVPPLTCQLWKKVSLITCVCAHL